MGGKIFISYRRGDDPGNAGRLFDQLRMAFKPGQVFMDVDSIAPGLDFARVLEDQVANCDVMLAIIGKHWIDSHDSTGARRLDDPNDFVRIEIEAGLKQGKRVIPVLMGEAQMPHPDELPDAIKQLAWRHAVRLTHERFSTDAQGFIKALQREFGGAKGLSREPWARLRSALLIAVGVIGVGAAATLVWIPKGPGDLAPVPKGGSQDSPSVGVFSADRVASDKEARAKKALDSGRTPYQYDPSIYFYWNSLSREEFEELARYTVVLIAVWTQNPEWLPVQRIYVRADGKEQSVYKVSSWRTPVNNGSLTAKMFGPHREDGFYLVSGGALLRKGEIVMDLSANVAGLAIQQLPSSLASAYAQRFPNVDPAPSAKPDLKTLQAVVQRLFPGFPVPQFLL
jgi:hypothetical protein